VSKKNRKRVRKKKQPPPPPPPLGQTLSKARKDLAKIEEI
jgi:hypothetical protein